MSEFEAEYIGISRFDDRLGYVPREGAPGWTNVKVTITNDGFRLNNVVLLAIHLHLVIKFPILRLGQHVLRKNLIGV
ncbi:MAG: hypothetical protein WBL91_19935 [Pseudolabrys sp.]